MSIRNELLSHLNDALPPGISNGTRALNVQTYTESNVKLGQQFGVTAELEIAQGATQYLTITTPTDTNVSVKTRLISTNGGSRYTPKLGGVFVDDGAVYPITNFNGQSSNVSGVVFRGNPSAVTSTGVGFDIVRSAAGVGNRSEQGIFSGDGIERILKKGETYLLEFENLDNNAIYIVYSITWFEGGLDLPL